jgi:hypothetical protein
LNKVTYAGGEKRKAVQVIDSKVRKLIVYGIEID